VTDHESFEEISRSFKMGVEPLVYFIAEVGEFVLCSNYPDASGAEALDAAP